MSKPMTENKSIIGILMKLYRRSPFHSASMGKFLASIMARFLVARDPLVVKRIGSVTFELDLREVIDSSLYFSGTFEDDVEQIINTMVKPGMCVLDIGANIGYHTFRMARLVGSTGSTYAIEPTQWAYQRLLRNFNLNPTLKNITFSKAALSNVDMGITQIQFQSSYRLDGRNQNKVESIEVITLDTYLEHKKITKLDFIKLDVDGYEGKVIQGASKSLAQMKPILLMEINPSAMIMNGDDPEQIINILMQVGYQFTTIKGLDIPDLSTYCRNNANASTMIVGTCKKT